MRRASWQARHVMPRVRCGQEPSRSRAARRHCSRTGFAAATAVAPDILEIDTKEAIATIRSLAVLTFAPVTNGARAARSEEHTSELQSQFHLVCRLLLEKKKNKQPQHLSNQ